ncbi:MAG: helix-turn-helix transcriptional regulator, partial [Planctomycetes bacterium]|nr:helix-turn-helix transcriptional regulator [Planctomycetota bacterium]
MAVRKTLLGSKIRRLRQERGLTQAQAAERLGISP